MKMRERISMLMLFAFVAATVLPALSSVLCTCSHHLAQESCCGESHCSHCAEAHNHSHLHFDTCCSCNHSHDTDLELYTLPEQNERGLISVAVINLIDMSFVSVSDVKEWGQGSELIYLLTPILRDGALISDGALRAPPVLA